MATLPLITAVIGLAAVQQRTAVNPPELRVLRGAETQASIPPSRAEHLTSGPRQDSTA